MNLSVPPPPPPTAGGVLLPPPPTRRGPASTHTVLLTHVPESLHNRQTLREWLVACGNSRNIQFVPSPPQVDNDEAKEDDDKKGDQVITALLTMSHADAALKVVSAFRHFKAGLLAEKTSEEANNNSKLELFQAHLVPTHPEVPLPPAVMDPTTVQVLGDKLLAAFPRGGVRSSPADNKDDKRPVTATTTIAPRTTTTRTSSTTKLGGGSDDEEEEDEDYEDPLQSPAVLQAVRDFRRQLERQQGSKATRRQELVRSKIAQLKPIIRERMLQEKQQQELASVPPPNANLPPPPPSGSLPPPPGTGNLPPPPPGGSLPLPPPGNLPPPPPLAPNLPPPPTSSLPPPGANVSPAAPRGVSNLPAWMTQQQQQQQQQQAAATTDEPPPAKRLKPAENWQTTPLTVDAAQRPALQAFVAAQIRQLLGEEEASLIEFLVEKVVVHQATPADLLPELQDVLEDDAPKFVQALWEKTQELAGV